MSQDGERLQISKRPIECGRGGFFFAAKHFWTRLRGWWEQYNTRDAK